MSSRALSLATAIVLIGGVATGHAENLEAGRSPAQIFAGTCAACHKSARGLVRTVPPNSLPSFLRQHYTTGTEMASMLSAYVLANGAADPRARGGLTKQGEEAKSGRAAEPVEAQPTRRQREAQPQEGARPEAAPEAEGERTSSRARRDARRQRREADRPEAVVAPDAQAPAAATAEEQPQDRAKGKKQRKKDKAKRESKPEPVEAAKPEPAKAETPKDEPAKVEAPKIEPAKPADTAKDEAAKPLAKPEAAGSEPAQSGSGASAATPKLDEGKVEGAKSEPGSGVQPAAAPTRVDPVPAVTPAPKPEGEAAPVRSGAETKDAVPAPVAPASSSSGDSAPASAAPSSASTQPVAPPPTAPGPPPVPVVPETPPELPTSK